MINQIAKLEKLNYNLELWKLNKVIVFAFDDLLSINEVKNCFWSGNLQKYYNNIYHYLADIKKYLKERKEYIERIK